jgi:hypothetical protein
MADRVDFYFRQRVTEAELDLAFALLEKADRDLAADLNIYGIVSGAVPAPHSPVPDLTVDLTAPGRAYDNLGQRMFFGTGQTVDCAVDLVGIPTDVATVGNERWLGIFLRFKRQLSDPRTDGNSQQVFFRRDESFELVVRQAPEGAIGVAPKPALQADELLLCDVRRRPGQTQILVADLDTSRRQAFIFAQGTSVAVTTGTWSILQPLAATVQAAFDEADAELRDHFTAVARRHAATAIDYAPHGFVGAGNVQAAVDELIDDLATGAVGSSGASRVGVDAAAGAPNALPAGSVKSQLAQLLGFLNTHVSAPTGAHNAAAIAATPHNNIAGTNVQAQLQEIVTDLVATGRSVAGRGARRRRRHRGRAHGDRCGHAARSPRDAARRAQRPREPGERRARRERVSVADCRQQPQRRERRGRARRDPRRRSRATTSRATRRTPASTEASASRRSAGRRRSSSTRTPPAQPRRPAHLRGHRSGLVHAERLVGRRAVGA